MVGFGICDQLFVMLILTLPVLVYMCLLLQLQLLTVAMYHWPEHLSSFPVSRHESVNSRHEEIKVTYYVHLLVSCFLIACMLLS